MGGVHFWCMIGVSSQQVMAFGLPVKASEQHGFRVPAGRTAPDPARWALLWSCKLWAHFLTGGLNLFLFALAIASVFCSAAVELRAPRHMSKEA